MNKNSKILLIAGGVVVAGAIGFIAWTAGDKPDSSVVGPVVSSQAGPDVGGSDHSTPTREEPSAGSGGSSPRLSADPDRGDVTAASEDTLVARKKKGDSKKGKRKNRRKATDSEDEDAGAGNTKKVPPAGNFEDDL